jgi:MFS family permease
MLRLIYGTAYTDNNVQSNVASIAFAGTVVGHLLFGVLSDRWSRKNSLLISTISQLAEPTEQPVSDRQQFSSSSRSYVQVLTVLVVARRACSLLYRHIAS